MGDGGAGPGAGRDLSARWQDGAEREAVFTELFEAHYRKVHRFFRRRGVPEEAAKDLCQVTFLHVYRGLERFQGSSSFQSWLFRIALNVFRQYLRRRGAAKRSAVEVSLDAPGGHAPAPADHRRHPLDVTLHRERRRRFVAALGRLPEVMQTCVRLHYFKGLSHREIGRRLGLTEGSVKTYQYEARKRLRADLAARTTEDP